MSRSFPSLPMLPAWAVRLTVTASMSLAPPSSASRIELAAATVVVPVRVVEGVDDRGRLGRQRDVTGRGGDLAGPQIAGRRRDEDVVTRPGIDRAARDDADGSAGRPDTAARRVQADTVPGDQVS